MKKKHGKKPNKPPYSLFSNAGFVFRRIWKDNKWVATAGFIKIPLGTAASVLATYLSAAVVSLAEKKAGDAELLLSLGGLSLALMLLYVGQSLMSYRTEMYYFGLNYSYLRDLNRKSMVVDYALLQSPHGQNMRSLADGNVDADDTYGSSNAALLPWRLLNLFSSVFGVFSFAAILSVLNPLLILLLAATTLVPYLTTQRYNKQRHEHREEEIVDLDNKLRNKYLWIKIRKSGHFVRMPR